MTYTVKVHGVEETRRELAAAGRRYSEAMRAAAFVALGEILKRSADQDAPRVTGELADSVFEERASPAVGGFGAEHAEHVHEREGRGWKFLQKRLAQETSGIPGRMAELVEEYARGGVTLSTARALHPEEPRLRRKA